MPTCFPQQIGTKLLVRQLRDLDANGAPLLFQAASSKGNLDFFRGVQLLLHSVLGVGGMIEQARAIDNEGKSLTMYAARSEHAGVYRCAVSIVNHAEAAVSMKIAHEHDAYKKSVLHHAAEAGGPDTLEAVLDSPYKRDFDRKDIHGRTPIMCLLAGGGCDSDQDQQIVQRKFKTMLHIQFNGDDTTKFRYLVNEGALIHAARGGRRVYEVVLSEMSRLWQATRNHPGGHGGNTLITLDLALGINELTSPFELARAHTSTGSARAGAMGMDIHEPDSTVDAGSHRHRDTSLDFTFTEAKPKPTLEPRTTIESVSTTVEENVVRDVPGQDRRYQLFIQAAQGGHVDLMKDIAEHIQVSSPSDRYSCVGPISLRSS